MPYIHTSGFPIERVADFPAAVAPSKISLVAAFAR